MLRDQFLSFLKRLFLFFYSYYYWACICVWEVGRAHMPVPTWEETRGHLPGVWSLLPSCRFWGSKWGLVTSTFACWALSPALKRILNSGIATYQLCVFGHTVHVALLLIPALRRTHSGRAWGQPDCNICYPTESQSWFVFSGWLGWCPLPPSLLQVPAHSFPNRRGWPSLIEEGWSSVKGVWVAVFLCLNL